MTVSRWKSFDASLGAWSFPAEPACYAVIVPTGSGSRVVYVGQTNNLRLRICQHGIKVRGYSDVSPVSTPWGSWRGVTVKAHFGVRYGDWAMRELRLIRRLNPWFNRRGRGDSRAA